MRTSSTTSDAGIARARSALGSAGLALSALALLFEDVLTSTSPSPRASEATALTANAAALMNRDTKG